MTIDVERASAESVALADGTELVVRQVRPDDKRLLADGLRRLSPESRYHRFFRPLTELTERDLAYLSEIDHHDHEALAAIDPESGRLVGVARCIRAAEPHLAEVSVVVGDPWQRRGVATLLLEHLVERARAAGITHFVALVMDENTDAIKLFEHRVPGHARPRRSASGHLELLIELPEPGRLPGSTLARVLRAVAHSAVVVNPYRVTREAIGRLRGE
ncbi:MAG: GNAT family N-acetyltransferase [Solirubrobacterales bacterium]